MSNHYQRYQNDIANTASQMVTQVVCAERGLDYNMVLASAQNAHLNGIMQQEQMRQMNRMLARHYGGDTLIGKLKDVFTGSSQNSFFPQSSFGMPVGYPALPVAPQPAVQPNALNITLPMDPNQVAQLLAVEKQEAQKQSALEKDIADLKQAVGMLLQAYQAPAPQGTTNSGQQNQPMF